MPHCILEITQNLATGLDKTDLMRQLANAINAGDWFVADDIKVRIYTLSDSFMGTEVQEHAFASAEIVLLDNKTKEQFSAIQENVHRVLTAFFSRNTCKESITSRLTFIRPEFYKRSVNY